MGPYQRMWVLLNLNDNEVEAMDNALIGMVGEGVDDLLEAIVHEHS